MLPRTILVGCDFSEGSRRALAWAGSLRASLGAELVIVHVDAGAVSEGMVRLDGSGSVETAEEHARRARRLDEELERAVSAQLGSDRDRVRVRIASGRAPEALCELALELGADLVIVGASGKSEVERVLLGSTTHALVRDCPIAVMTVH